MVRKLTAALLLMLSLVLVHGARPDASVLCLLTGEENCCVEIDGEMRCTQGCCEPAENDCCLVLEEEFPSFVAPEKKPVPNPILLATVPDPAPDLGVRVSSLRTIARSQIPDPPPRHSQGLLAWLDRRLI